MTMSVFQDHIPEFIPSQNHHLNMGPNLAYGVMDIWKFRMI
jgi:hypothetical protein